MKKRIILVVLLSLIALFSTIGSVGAYMRKQTEVVENVLVPAEVSCEIVETFRDNKKSEILIENTGDIEVYLRLHIVTYWLDSNGDILYKPSPVLNTDIDIVYDKTCWLKSGDTYYYMFPVPPGDTGNRTMNLLKDDIVLNFDDDDGSKQVVEIFAEAIQSKPEEAVENSWKVTVTDGNITSVN